MNKKLLQSSVDNIHIKAIQDRVDLDALIAWSKTPNQIPLSKKERAVLYINYGKEYMKRKEMKETWREVFKVYSCTEDYKLINK